MSEALKVVEKIFEELVKEDEIADVVDKHNQKMGIEENWVCGWEQKEGKIEIIRKSNYS